MSNQEKIPYEEVFEALNKVGVNYVVCGGAAVVLFGFARLTVDLDLIVSLEKENLEKLYTTLTRLNYKLKIPVRKEDFIQKEKLARFAKEKNMKVVSFYNAYDPFKIIDIGVNLPRISYILKRKKHIKVGNLRIPTILINDLIEMKRDLARPQDLIDVVNLKKLREQRYEKNKSQ